MSQLSRALEGLGLDEMIGSFALGIAQAQHDLDAASLRAARILCGSYAVAGTDALGKPTTTEVDTRVDFLGERLSLLDLGFTPTFYQFSECSLEVKVSYSMSQESFSENKTSTRDETTTTRTRRTGFLGLGGSVTTTHSRISTVDARFASRFAYSASAAAKLKTRLVPVPPPAELLQTLRFLESLPPDPVVVAPPPVVTPPPKPAPRPKLLNVNTATPEQLAALPGLDAALAERIVARRPYTSKTQLKSGKKKSLTPTQYDAIRALVVANR